jgi:hypothetical protein
MKLFFAEEKLEWDYVTAEVGETDSVQSRSKAADSLVRLFRAVGFCKVDVNYAQPLLGLEQVDTSISAVLLLLPHVEMDSISCVRLLGIVTTIYRDHYCVWYSIYPHTISAYRTQIEKALKQFQLQLDGKTEIPLRRTAREFLDADASTDRPLHDVIPYLVKVLASAIAAAGMSVLMRKYSDFSTTWLVGVPAAVFVLVVATVSLADKKRFEAFKLLVSLVTRFFDR